MLFIIILAKENDKCEWAFKEISFHTFFDPQSKL